MSAQHLETDDEQILSRLRSGDWLDRQEFPPLAWAVPGLIPEGFGLFTGAPKAGKSWAALGICLAVASGKPAFGKIAPGPARPVLLLALEDGHRRLQGRCRHLLDGQPIPDLLDFQTDARPGEVVAIMDAWLRRHGHCRPLVALDTLGKVMPPRQQGEDSYGRDYRVGSGLKRLVDQHPGSSLLVVHHTRKTTAEDWMDSTSGTQGLNGAADWTVNLARARNETAGILRVTGRDVPEGEYAITSESGRWTIDGNELAEAAAKAADAKTKANLGDNTRAVLEYVMEAGRPVSAKEVADALEMPRARDTLLRLVDAGRLKKARRGLYELRVAMVASVANTESLDSLDMWHGSDPEGIATVATVATPPHRECTRCGDPLDEGGLCRLACEVNE